jgi:hypothetical protein
MSYSILSPCLPDCIHRDRAAGRIEALEDKNCEGVSDFVNHELEAGKIEGGRKTTNRRKFCRSVASAGIAFPFFSWGKSRGSDHSSLEKSSSPEDETYWSKVRAEFLLEDDLAYFNNASIGLPPKSVVEAVSKGYYQLAASPIQGRAALYGLLDKQKVRASLVLWQQMPTKSR